MNVGSSSRRVYVNNVRTSNVDSVRLFFAVDSLYAYVRIRMVGCFCSIGIRSIFFFVFIVVDVVVIVVTLIRSMLQDIIFSHGVPALRTELFCNRVASEIFQTQISIL